MTQNRWNFVYKRPCGLILRICSPAVMLFIGTNAFGYINPEVIDLISEKQRKIDQLEQCSQKTKGFKIAGISTIGLTAVGIAGNVALSNEREDVSQKLSNAKTTLAKQQAEQRQAEIDAAKKAAVDDARAQEIANIKLNPDDVGNGYRYKGINGSGPGKFGNYKKCPEITKNGDWCVVFGKYIVQGTSACVDDIIHGSDAEYTAAANQSISPAQSKGEYCYCKMTSWTPDGGKKIDTSASSWVFQGTYSDAANCANACALRCGSDVPYEPDFRGAVFGSFAK